ncbi:helix-turn-helix transcriptional regulator [Haloactinopolyspora sp.]|uniref:helix-turn-helix transcriptional regulator n=1 Tax=Haloactinopolyspora sp. TaxID=1966353 RepID=UPI002634DA3A|nr:helix-turn-helix transcriptional regulator [Haloactinopolyspora sp.]
MKADELRGHLDALILAVVKDAPLHGYGISEALHAQSGGAIELPTGTLYPALRRLERLGYLRSSWSTVSGRKRRTYELTRAGRGQLAAQRQAWSEFSGVVGGILGTGA